VLAASLVGAAGGAALAHLLGGSSGSTAQPAAAATWRSVANVAARTTPLSAEQIYRRAAPAVVSITSTQTENVPPTLFSPPMKERVGALGSGFVVDRRGDIVTNDHVVQGGTGIRVGFSNGATYPARAVGTDPSTDVAVVRVKAPASALHPLSFGDSARLEVGDPVYAIGNPFGLDRTMTAGIVSATERDIQAPNGLTIANAVQTDAPINHGNSGGPLLDRFDHVVGINSQIEGGTVDGNIGVGFAIPSDTARAVSGQLIATGRVEHAWLGVEVDTIDPALAGIVRGLPRQGVTIARVVKDSPAAKAGLKGPTHEVTVNGQSVSLGGDVIVAVDGKGIGGTEQLGAVVATHKPGDRLQLTVLRGGARRNVVVTLGNVPAHVTS